MAEKMVYLEQHRSAMEASICRAVKQAIGERADDPVVRVGELLLQAAGGAGAAHHRPSLSQNSTPILQAAARAAKQRAVDAPQEGQEEWTTASWVHSMGTSRLEGGTVEVIAQALLAPLTAEFAG